MSVAVQCSESKVAPHRDEDFFSGPRRPSSHKSFYQILEIAIFLVFVIVYDVVGFLQK